MTATDGYWVTNADDAAVAAAAELGFAPVRRLLQMRRPLPLPDDLRLPAETRSVETRAFDPERDVDEWLDVNNAAFAWHPEQGGWTRATLVGRMTEPWFDRDGFRVAEIDGSMAGFCWTKVHADHEPPLGEIYVVAVAPARIGSGLGSRLTVAGLEWLWHERQTPIGMLYVESDNDRAVSAYVRLGFETHSIDTRFA